MLSSGTFWKVAAGAGVLMVGYCIYFDRKRRSDPLFKQKLRESKFVICCFNIVIA